MATYSDTTFSAYSGTTLDLIVTTSSQGANSTTLAWSIRLRGEHGGSYAEGGPAGTHPWNFKTSAVQRASGTNTYYLVTDTNTYAIANSTYGPIGHDGNGELTVNVSAYFSGHSSLGWAEASGNYTPARIPLAPQGLTQSVTSFDSTTAAFNVDISSRGHGVTCLHELQYKKASSGTWLGTPDQNCTDTVTNVFNLAGLEPATEYDYRQRAWNNKGDQSYSGSSSFTTLGYAVISPFTVTATDTVITGDVTVDETCDLLEYKLDGGSWIQAFSGDYTSKTFDVEDLASGTDFTLQTRVRRKDSQLYTESSVENITTEIQNNFIGFKVGR